MRQAGLRARAARRDTATPHSHHDVPVAEHVIGRPFRTARPPAVGMADIPYGPTADGWVYLATRHLVGGACKSRMTQARTLTALDRAVARHRPPAGVRQHADRGSQYAAAADPARLARTGMPASMSRTGHGWDHARIESGHRLTNKDRAYRHDVRTRTNARLAIVAHLEMWSNRQRLHSALGYRTPLEAAVAARTASAVWSSFRLSTILT